ncbi:NAD(P)H-dependent flavin oxidoreductase [Streptococcus moroccensis]|uniref:Probable nitronate monooxygenase n=1 Tax=Streptococcus moroccensis TaxID=1451356 RepID=A0ABT9YQG7_9STRE|nr:nitronate monooxygenase [Streptococcus moroccensis]MDQ0222241.1 enoyl-[acyl-carrier protein] reductase II [Streptococcus moroccensis]
MMNQVVDILGITYPVIQAPMTWITSPEMVAAVSNAGGLGVMGISAGFEEQKVSVEDTTEEMRKQIRQLKTLTDKPFGVNVFTEPFDAGGFSKATIEMLKEENVTILVAAGPVVPEQIKSWKEDGFTVIFRDMFPTIRGAVLAQDAGADILVATGSDEGGGMSSHAVSAFALTALMKEAVTIPVLVAGGVVNQPLAKAAKAVGADGLFVGTRFILSKECRASAATKEDILHTHPDDYIVVTQAGGGMQWRSTPHKVAKTGQEQNQQGNLNADIGSFYEGMLKGNLDAGINTVSNVASLIKSIDSCEEIVLELAKGFEVE